MSNLVVNKDSTNGVIQRNSDSRVSVQLQWEGRARDVSASTIKAGVVSFASTPPALVGTEVVLSSATPGAAWASGVVVVVLPATLTSQMDAGDARLVIYENDGSHTWAYPVMLRVEDYPAG